MTNPEKFTNDAQSSSQTAGSLNASDPEGKSMTESQPRLTLLASGQSPGEVLRIAREKLGLSLEEVGQRTKINIHQLRAIESGDTTKFPPETFARAFIKSYCKLVNLEAAPLLAAYGLDSPSVAASPSRSGLRPEGVNASMPSSSRRLSSLSFDRSGSNKRIGYLVGLAIVVALVGFYIPEFISSSNDEIAIAVPPESASAAPSEGVVGDQQVPVAPSVAISQDGVVQETVALLTTDESANNGDPALAAATKVFPALQAPQDASTPIAGAVNPQSAPTADQTIATAPTVTRADENTAPSSTTAGQSVLSFTFGRESWVTVRDANDRVLMSRLNQAGDTAMVEGKRPFKLIVGNAASVELTTDGEKVDLVPHIRGEVARLTIE